jgi:hypothetical protein
MLVVHVKSIAKIKQKNKEIEKYNKLINKNKIIASKLILTLLF